MPSFFSLIQPLRDRRRRHQDNTRRNAAARRALQNILAARPDWALPADLKAHIERDAIRRFGSKAYAPWLEVFTTWRREWVDGLLPDNYVYQYVVPYSAGRFQALGEPTIARRAISTTLFPDVAYTVNGGFYDSDWQPIRREALAEYLFRDTDRIYLKLEWAYGGSGVFRLTPETFDVDALPKENAVFQRGVHQHPEFQRLSPDAAATVRITTVHVANRKPYPAACQVRLGRKGETHISKYTNLRVAVDLENGRFTGQPGLSNWTPLEVHPDFGYSLTEGSLYGLADIVEAVTDLHGRFPHIRYIGWDATITADNDVAIFEANTGHAGTVFGEATTGPVFKGLDWDKLHLRNGA